jgi:hypothetical protein
MSFNPLLIGYTFGCILGGGLRQATVDIITSYHECHHIGHHIGRFLAACLISLAHIDGILVLVAADYL